MGGHGHGSRATTRTAVSGRAKSSPMTMKSEQVASTHRFLAMHPALVLFVISDNCEYHDILSWRMTICRGHTTLRSVACLRLQTTREGE